jgi:DNA-binding beta-propeller fold protein YncE
MIALLLPTICGCDPPPLSNNGVVRIFGSQGMGPGEFGYARAIDMTDDGTIFIVDKTARVQRFSPDGSFETSWTLPDKQAGKPVGITVTRDGRVFVADTHYHRVIVYDRDGNELARFGHAGTADGQFLLPTDVAIDTRGFIYVSEYNGNDRVTKWTPDYAFDSVVVDGDIEGKPLRRPSAITIDDQDTLWIADACNHRILRFTLDGHLMSSFGQMGQSQGKMRYPYDITFDAHNRLIVCEYGNSRLQWFERSGESVRVWGHPGRKIGELNAPWGVSVGPDGNVYVLDSHNARVQVIRL